MRYQTELMRAILTSERAQKMVDYVSPLYGESYVGLWIFEAQGFLLDEIYGIARALRQETTPVTTDLLLDYWETHYDIPIDSSLTKEQRRNRIIAKILSRGPCNPARLSAAVSAAVGGDAVDITENVAKNTFLVNVQGYGVNTNAAISTIARLKPAHLIYEVWVKTDLGPLETRFGGAMGTITRTALPELPDKLDFEATLYCGGLVAATTQSRLPELPDKLDFESTVRTGGLVATESRSRVPEITDQVTMSSTGRVGATGSIRTTIRVPGI